MFEHLFFIYLNYFLRTIFVRIIILIYLIMSCPYRIRILVFRNLSCPHIISLWSYPCPCFLQFGDIGKVDSK